MKDYLQRLVELAEELQAIQDDKNGYHLNKYDVIRSKINYLIGYILASKDLIPTQSQLSGSGEKTPKGLDKK